ncbi:MAG: hypothetical protein Q4E13_00050 [Clostridia bacterium]|nr:hypothetical protein [Clostridia bacterium]
MQEYSYVRCLFCLTGYENDIVQIVNAEQLGIALFPTKVKRFKNKGQWEENIKPLFPGYVFVYSQESYPLNAFYRFKQVIRPLRYNDDPEGYLKGNDLRFAQWIWEQQGRVEALKAIRVGDRVEIVDGVFQNLNGKVLAMDKRKQAARIELNVVGGIKQIWMSFVYLDEFDRNKNPGLMTE